MKQAQAPRSENNFDFIRFVAAVLVIITHSQALLGLGGEDLLSAYSRGTMLFSQLGVLTFFIISGYLIAQSLSNSGSYRRYLWRRTLRILPGLAVVMLLIVFVLGPIVTTLPLHAYFSSSETYAALISISMYRLHLFLPGVFKDNPEGGAINGSLWTLAYEFSLYILLLIAFVLGLFKHRVVIVILWLLLFAIRLYLRDKYYIYSYGTPYLLNLNIRYAMEFCFYFGAGVLYFLYREQIQYRAWIFIVALLVIILTVFFNVTFGRLTYYICLPYMVFYLAFLPGPFRQFGRYGDFSYGLYIYAYPVQQTIVHYTHARIGLMPMIIASLVCTFPLAVLSWHVVEKRALQFKNLIT
jgi:peptidoglycan/LPS O-acetylase OafA/YrhL